MEHLGAKIDGKCILTLSVVSVYAFGGFELIYKGCFSDPGCPQDCHGIGGVFSGRRDALDGRLCRQSWGHQTVAAGAPSSERVSTVYHTWKKKEKI